MTLLDCRFLDYRYLFDNLMGRSCVALFVPDFADHEFRNQRLSDGLRSEAVASGRICAVCSVWCPVPLSPLTLCFPGTLSGDSTLPVYCVDWQ